ncbi:peptidoglycan-associated lipoprotein Pal [Alkalimonas sp.]|uniref:peptidoglycan-associated lipoprotein Pal n=1 Tax=Alkalimonas sp. TaxID=1872453 RepID=UPI00263ABACA|nr:peptidoglycan-associated lipoprotein Pal [Alkalimonas sp.]MCC5825873.1 peptidoglycan-associated lipoprotein Pal [Alkalimonas sp.]
MNVHHALKGILIALPILTLAACSSTSQTSVSDAEAEAARRAQMERDAAVQVERADQAVTPAERVRQQMEALRQENVIYFDFDRSTIRQEFVESLRAHGEFLRTNPSVRVTIEGHTDERGTPEYNIALGERRAQAVVQYLQNLGVPANQMRTVSYGEERPVDMSRTEAGFAKNRRAVLVY